MSVLEAELQTAFGSTDGHVTGGFFLGTLATLHSKTTEMSQSALYVVHCTIYCPFFTTY